MPHDSAPIVKSTLEDVDMALFDFIDNKMDIRTTTNKGFRKVPVIWSGSERAHNIKDDGIDRDKIGMVTLPVIAIERSNVKKDRLKRTIPFAMVDPHGDLKGGYLTVKRLINQDKTGNFANADAFRRAGQQNYALYRHNVKNSKIVYQTSTIPIPIYVDMTYKIYLRTEYQEQMNDLLTPFIRSSNAHKRIMIVNGSNKYEAFIQEDYQSNNKIVNYETNERKYETIVTVSALGYLIGDDKNQVRPRVATRENSVQIRFAKERIIVGDIDDGEFRF